MQNELIFRPPDPDDRKTIKTILEDAFEDYGIDLPAGYSFGDIEDIQGAYVQTGGAFRVLVRGHRLVGFFGLVHRGGRHMELKRLYLQADERGKGIGHLLIRQAIRTARQMGCEHMHLETTSRFKEAVGLYHQYGFVSDPDARVSPGHDIAMVKVL